MTSPTRTDVDGLPELVGRTLGPTAWRDLAQRDVDGFAAAVGDDAWVHVDPATAAEGPFAGTIAPPPMLLGLLPRLTAELLEVTDGAVRLVSRVDAATFPATTPVGTAVRAEARVTAVDAAPGGAEVVLAVTVERDGGLAPSLVAEVALRYYR